MTAWKEFEDRVCRALGGRRILGNRGSGVPDSDENVRFSVEAKHGYEKFALRADWLTQARRNAVPGKPWILVQAPKRSRTPLVTLEFAEFVKIATAAGLVSTQTEGENNEGHPDSRCTCSPLSRGVGEQKA